MRISILMVVVACFGAATPSYAAPQTTGAQQIFAQCKAKTAESRFRYHRCLVAEYERLMKRTDIQTDKLLGLVGGYKPFGRMRIIQWSNAISKSQSRWQKLIVWDCEWPGHLSLEIKGAAAAMTECRIDRVIKRVQLLDNRIKDINTVIITDKQKDK